MRTLRSALAVMATSVLLPLAGSPQAGVAQTAPGATLPPASVRVAVFPLSAPGSQRDLAEVFRSMMHTELGSARHLLLVERQEIDRLLGEHSVNLTRITDQQVIDIGKLLGAQYAVTGSIWSDSRDARLDLRMIDIETSETVSRPFKETVPNDRMLALVDRVAVDFVGNVRVKPRVQDVATPPAAALAYSRGLDFEKRGRREEAAAMYQKALEMFPQHPHARAALQRVN